MKKFTKAIILLSALLILIGGYCCMQQMKMKTTVKEKAETVPLSLHTKEDLTGLSWRKESDAYAFTLKDGMWVTTDQPAWPAVQSEIQSMADKLLSLQCSRTLKDASNMADYGLETPAFSVTASWKDGSSTTYDMGDATPFKDGYYVRLSDRKDVIYTVNTSLASVFSRDKKKLVAMEKIPETKEITHLEIGQSIIADKKETSITVDPEQLWYQSDTNIPLDGEMMDRLVMAVATLTWNELVTTTGTAEERKTWSLDDESAMRVTAVGKDDTTRTILIGGKNNEGDFYACLPDSNLIYTIKAKTLEPVMDATIEHLTAKKLMPISYDTLQSVELKTSRVTRSYTKEPAADDLAGEEGEAPDKTNADEKTRQLWDMIADLRAATLTYAGTSDSQLLSIRAKTNGGMERTVVFFEYTADEYLAVVDGETAFTIPADHVDQLIRHIHTAQ